MNIFEDSILNKDICTHKYKMSAREYKNFIDTKQFKNSFFQIKKGVFLKKEILTNPYTLANYLFSESYITGLTALNIYWISPNNSKTIFSFWKKIHKPINYWGYEFICKNIKYREIHIEDEVYHKEYQNNYIRIAKPEKSLLDFYYYETFYKKLWDLHDFYLEMLDFEKLEHLSSFYPEEIKNKVNKLLLTKKNV